MEIDCLLGEEAGEEQEEDTNRACRSILSADCQWTLNRLSDFKIDLLEYALLKQQPCRTRSTTSVRHDIQPFHLLFLLFKPMPSQLTNTR